MAAPLETMLASSLAHGIRPGLERISALLTRMGEPQLQLRTLHVAGTNGKGSVCAMLTSVLQEAGYRVGRYTSPHLISYRERLWCDGRNIPADRLAALLLEVDSLTSTLPEALGPITEFERLTAAGFAWLAEQRPDWAVIEVGLGGRLDATNVLERPELTIITRIARDHVDYLGEDLAGIAREKAGILKPGTPLVTGAEAAPREVLRQEAARVGAAWIAAPDAAWLGSEPEGDPVRLGETNYRLGLRGSFQARNAAIALAALQALEARGWAIGSEAIARGLAQPSWPGRLERWTAPDGTRFCFDGAHNLDGVEALGTALAPGDRVVLAGTLQDKDPDLLLPRLASLGTTVVLTIPPSPRGADPASCVASLPPCELHVEPDWRKALELARDRAGGREILVVGSLYLVGAVCGALGRTFVS